MQLPSVLRRPAAWLALGAGLAAYAAAGFVAVPRVAGDYLRSLARADYGRELGIGAVAFNPFTLALELRDVALPDADGGPLIAFRRLAVDLEVASLWRRAWTFRSIAIDGLAVEAVLRPGGALNLGDLAAPPAGADPATAPDAAPLPRLYVADLAVTDGRVRYTDRDRPAPATVELAPIDFTLRDFSTHVEAGERYELAATLSGGASVRWAGTLRAEPLASVGEFAITGARLPVLAGFLDPEFPVVISAGELALAGRYTLADAARGLEFRVTDGTARANGLAFRARGDAADPVVLPTLAATGITVDTVRRVASVAEVTAADGTLDVVLAPDGSVNLAALAGDGGAADGQGPGPAAVPQDDPAGYLADDRADDPPGEPDGNAAAAAAATDPDWTVSVPRISVAGFRVAVTDQTVTPAAVVEVAPLALELTGFSTAPDSVVQTVIEARINGAATLTATAETRLDTLATTAEFALAGLDLAGFQPYASAVANLSIRRGRLGARGRLVAEPDGDATGLAFDGEVDVDDFRAVDPVLAEDFLRWRSLRLAGVAWRASPGSLRVREVVARGPYVRLIIGPDGVTNLDTVFAPPGGPVTVAATAPSTAVTATAADPVLPVRIDRVRVVDGAMNFADFAITPRFATGIEALNGTVRGLASDPSARATVDLDGQVDRFSPVTIRGEVNPLAAETYLDLAMGFRNFELASFTPYSGRFAGYQIRQGKLTVDLRYRVDDRKLVADHHIVINRFELGDKVDSPDAVGLPLKLAVALLKDRNGVIDLDLPVEGSLDDPQFRVGPIVWKALVNLLTRVATAPFKLLGSLFAGGEDINLLSFAPGSAAVAGEPFAPLTRALVERPGIDLDVPAVYSPALDGPVLAEERFRASVVTARRRELAARGGDPDSARWEDLAGQRDDYLRLLRVLWRQSAGDDAPLPVPADPGPDGMPRDPRDPEARIAAVEAALRARVTVTEADLFALARARAEVVQAQLLEGTGIGPERVFLVSPVAVEPRDGRVVMELALH